MSESTGGLEAGVQDDSRILPEPPRAAVFAGLLLVALGVALMLGASVVEEREIEGQPWRFAVLSPEGAPPWDGCVPMSARRIPLPGQAKDSRLVEELKESAAGRKVVEGMGLDHTERLLMFALPSVEEERLLDSGRMPTPGEPEVLAGDLARFDVFEIDGITFRVTGRLDRAVSGLSFAYVMPEHESMRRFFDEADGGSVGWFDADASARIEEGLGESLEAYGGQIILGGGRTGDAVSWAVLAGLLLVAIGGAIAQMKALMWVGARPAGVFTPVLRELRERPGLLLAMHLLLYGGLFASMALAQFDPLMNLRLVQLVGQAFSEGDLSYIGKAYASGNVLLAAVATFYHNYVVATCLWSIVPSLFIPFIGVVKNLISFVAVGYVMAPLWVGNAAQNSYHSITLTLELEAYVVACFIVSVMPIRIVSAARDGSFARNYVEGLKCIASGVILVGVMLAIAALYEAATLTAFGGL